MMRYVSLCFVLFLVACGPAEDQSSDVFVSKAAKAAVQAELDAAILANGTTDFPLFPDAELTPGVRCTKSNDLRYPEKIKYCERSVSAGTKRNVISTYDDHLHYKIEDMDRDLFKIDHYIPLCMGGDNAKTNLWPQHRVSYTRTDPIEQALCLLLSRGKITQDESIEQLLYAKAHLDETDALFAEIDKLL